MDLGHSLAGWAYVQVSVVEINFQMANKFDSLGLVVLVGLHID